MASFEAKEIKVTTTPTADYVFEDSYQLPNLESGKHIKEKRNIYRNSFCFRNAERRG